MRPLVGLEMRDMTQPFPEAVVVEPMLPGRRRLGVFDNLDDSDDTFYAPVEAFEGRHRYDPAFQWEPKEEQRLVRKVSDTSCHEALADCTNAV